MDSRPGDETLLLLVLGLMPFAVQTDISYADLICIFGWVFAASRAGRAVGPRPRQVAICGLILGTAGMAEAALVAASVPMPTHSLSRDITYGAELLAGIPVALYPVWLIVLSYRLPAIWLAASAPRGGRPQQDPGAGLPPRLADT